MQALCNNTIFTEDDKNEIYQIFCLNLGDEVRMTPLNLITVIHEIINENVGINFIDIEKLEEIKRTACETIKELKKIDLLQPLYPGKDIDYYCQD